MDVSLPPGNQHLICDLCGYSRRGLPHDAQCPECGEPSPEFAGSTATAALPIEELRWLRTLAIGIWLLIFTSVGALQVALIMPLRELSIGAINYPGPKLFASALVQRTIGGMPGPQGVFGTLCVMLSALAVFLLTEPRILHSQNESFWSLRRRTRWVSLLSIGGFGGLVISGFDPTIAYRGSLSFNLFILGVLCCELPANTLLYLYLRHLSSSLGDRRASGGLGFCVIAVPILCIVAVLLLALGPAEKTALPTAWRLTIMVYGSAALTAGVIGTTAVLRLAWALTLAAVGAGVVAARSATTRLPNLLRKAMARADLYGSRWCVVAGLVLWLASVPFCIQNVLYTPIRFAFGGGVPLLNFAGPKLSSFSLVRGAALRDEDQLDDQALPLSSQLSADAMTLLAVWLLTYTMPGLDPSPNWRWTARYGVLAMLGASLGVVLSVNNLDSLGPAHFTAWAVLTTEAPGTFILYTYLARLAKGLEHPQLARSLGRLAWAAAAIAIAPLPCFVLSARLSHWRTSWLAAGLGAGFVTLSFAMSLVACTALARLAWSLARDTLNCETATPTPILDCEQSVPRG